MSALRHLARGRRHTDLVDEQDNLSSGLIDEILNVFTPSTSNIPCINNLNHNVGPVQDFLQGGQGSVDQVGDVDVLFLLHDLNSSLGFRAA